MPERKRLRLRTYDYTSPGAYFVTVCAHQRRHLFGEVVAETVHLSPAGEAVQAAWEGLSESFPGIQVDISVVMPNHFHGVLIFMVPVPAGLGGVLRSFKSRASRAVRKLQPGLRVWQRGYFEHVVRNDRDLDRIRAYVVGNPHTWDSDNYNSDQRRRDEFDQWLRNRSSLPDDGRAGDSAVA